MTNKERILERAVALLKDAPEGIRYSVLVKQIQESLPDVPLNTIHGNIWNVESRRPETYPSRRRDCSFIRSTSRWCPARMSRSQSPRRSKKNRSTNPSPTG